MTVSDILRVDSFTWPCLMLSHTPRLWRPPAWTRNCMAKPRSWLMACRWMDKNINTRVMGGCCFRTIPSFVQGAKFPTYITREWQSLMVCVCGLGHHSMWASCIVSRLAQYLLHSFPSLLRSRELRTVLRDPLLPGICE